MRPTVYARIKDAAAAAAILLGFVAALVVPFLWKDPTIAWFSGVYFGWLGTLIYFKFRKFQDAEHSH